MRHSTRSATRADALCAALRSRFRFAVVDEAQDTDLIQWRIFHRLFVEGTTGQRLFIVGDPKQAIFAFRGADVQAFLAAAKELRTDHHAALYPLDVNWRSCPELLTALNQLFGAGGWFDDTGIDCTPVRAADEKERPFRIVADRTGRAALSLVDLTGVERIAVARKHMARFIATEVRRLVPEGGLPALDYQAKDKLLSLQAGDICVLVSKKREAIPILEELRKARIPFTFYKQTGLWQSEAAIHLDYLLKALAAPHDAAAFRQALLTQFFRIAPRELARAAEPGAGHPARAVPALVRPGDSAALGRAVRRTLDGERFAVSRAGRGRRGAARAQLSPHHPGAGPGGLRPGPRPGRHPRPACTKAAPPGRRSGRLAAARDGTAARSRS